MFVQRILSFTSKFHHQGPAVYCTSKICETLSHSGLSKITVCRFFLTLAHLGPWKVVNINYFSDVLGYGVSRYQGDNYVGLYKIPETWSCRWKTGIDGKSEFPSFPHRLLRPQHLNRQHSSGLDVDKSRNLACLLHSVPNRTKKSASACWSTWPS